MNATFPILAQPLAPDNIWFAVLLVVVLALMHGLSSLKNHATVHWHAPHHLHGVGHRLRELIMHRHD